MRYFVFLVGYLDTLKPPAAIASGTLGVTSSLEVAVETKARYLADNPDREVLILKEIV